ncbi:troponin I-like isoform X1 [Limulus polyphemus]|uniref:Troponin I-like isoform X1 n=2 Tax=Limulus polyphemus TaxID=6850 RepID=A0ABM1BH15_LIMPO|nr:troponin I-like isoform X1 [Limulus polyphemus]
MSDTMSEEERRKKEEKDRKKADVRKRLEEAAKAKKGKKGFMTPERKKKLRQLLRKKAAEELKKEQERKAEERKKIILQRTGNPKSMDGANEATLQAICKEYHKRILGLEDAKYDLEYEVRQKDFLINELNIQVNDLRGKFVKPTLKKVSKYEGKFEKLKAIAKNADMDFRATLKSINKDKFKLGEEKESERPEWALGKKKEEGEKKAAGEGEEEEQEEEEEEEEEE